MDIHSLYERICNMLPITWLDGEVLSFQKKLSSQLDQYWGLIKEIDIKDRPAEWDDIKIIHSHKKDDNISEAIKALEL